MIESGFLFNEVEIPDVGGPVYSRFFVEFSEPVRWIDEERRWMIGTGFHLDKAAQLEFDSLGYYHMFGSEGSGAGNCWHEKLPTIGDEYEIHEVQLFLYIPYAPTFPAFLFKKMLNELERVEPPKKFTAAPLVWPLGLRASDLELLRDVLAPDHLKLIEELKSQIQDAFERSQPNPFTYTKLQELVLQQFSERYRYL
jgi:hypothetical protein